MLMSSLALISPNVIVAYASLLQPSGITISPATGQSGTEVTVRGSGFSPGSTISMRFDGNSVSTSPGTVTVKLDGTFSAQFVVPTGSEGQKEVRATDNALLRNSASATFQQTGESSGGQEEEQNDDPAARSQSVKIAEDD